MKYLDKVRVLRDSDEYKKAKVFKGMIGTIIDAEIRDNCFHVVFVDPKTLSKDFKFTDESIKTIEDDKFCVIKIQDLEVVKEYGANDDLILNSLPKHNPNWWCKVEDGFIINLKGERKNKIHFDYNS